MVCVCLSSEAARLCSQRDIPPQSSASHRTRQMRTSAWITSGWADKSITFGTALFLHRVSAHERPLWRDKTVMNTKDDYISLNKPRFFSCSSTAAALSLSLFVLSLLCKANNLDPLRTLCPPNKEVSSCPCCGSCFHNPDLFARLKLNKETPVKWK